MENPPQPIMSKAELEQIKMSENNHKCRENMGNRERKTKSKLQCECGMLVRRTNMSNHS